MLHFERNCLAVIEGSFVDLYGSGIMGEPSEENYKEYSLVLLDANLNPLNSCAWYREEQLSLVSNNTERGKQIINKVIMKIKIERVTSWQRVVDAARFTERKDALGHEPSDQFKRHILRSEHSPIRLLEYDIKIYDIPYFSAMHFVRHFMGIEKFVSTQRPDRTHSGKTRHELPQDAPVNVWFSCNAQALINISRVRLCNKADATTQKIWWAVVDKICLLDPILAEFLVPSCVARGFCPEIKSCGWVKTEAFKEQRMEYVEDI